MKLEGKKFDLVEARLDRRPVDLVEELWGNPHGILCKDFKPEISESGTVYCRACGCIVGSIADISDCFCPRCDCAIPVHHHETGNCLGCGQECNIWKRRVKYHDYYNYQEDRS
jgi:hypothetical protein